MAPGDVLPTDPAPGAAVLCLDIGSTGVRAARFSGAAAVRGTVHERRYRTADHALTGRPDAAVVLAAVLEVLAEVDGTHVRAVAMAVQWQTLLAVDAADRPLSQVFTWESVVPEADLARVRHDLRGVWSRAGSGTYLHASSPVAAVHSLALPGAAGLTDLAGWIVRRLTGRDVGWSPVVAAASGLWHQPTGTWDDGVLSALHLDEARLGGLWQRPVHPLAGSVAAGWSPDAIWLPPLGDGLCHNLGLGEVGAHRTVVTVGTSGSVRAVLPGRPAVPDGLWAFGVGERSTAVGGAVTSAGNVLEWAEAFTGLPVPWSSFAAPVPVLPAVRVVPDVFGRRGPDYPDGALGAVIGLGPGSALGDVMAAVGIDVWRAFAVLQALLDTVTGQAPDGRPVTAAGGVLDRHPVVGQLLADALDRPVRRSGEDQPALRGAALVAGRAVLDPAAGVRSWVDAVVDDLAAPGRDPRSADRFAAGAGGPEAPSAPSAPSASGDRIVHPRPHWVTALRARWAG